MCSAHDLVLPIIMLALIVLGSAIWIRRKKTLVMAFLILIMLAIWQGSIAAVRLRIIQGFIHRVFDLYSGSFSRRDSSYQFCAEADTGIAVDTRERHLF